MATVKKDKKKKIIIAISVVLVVAILSTVIGVTAQANKKTAVSLNTIGTGEINETVSSTGLVSSGSSKEYKVNAVATVKEVFVKVGDEVKEGDLLATFDTSALDSQVKELNSTYNQARDSYKQAVADQKAAKSELADLQDDIESLEKEVESLGGSLEDVLSTMPSQDSDGSEWPSFTLPTVTLPSTTQPSTDDNTSDTTTTEPTESVTAQNVKENTTAPSTTINWAQVGQSIAGSSGGQLASAELRLAALYAQEEVLNIQASDDTVYAKKQVMDTAKSALDTVKEAQAELDAGWTAAFDGTITACDITPGEQTNLLTSGITLENFNSMVVTLSLGEYDIHKVKVGMPATITTAYGKYTGQVLSKAPVATGGSSGSILDSVGSMAGISGLSSLTESGAGVEVQISVDNPDENIIVGFDADVEINVGDHTNIITVPIESIVLEKTGTYVYLYNEEEGTVTKTLIETGAVSDSAYEVTSGLKVGDKIVATPSSDYEEDTFEVKVQTK